MSENLSQLDNLLSASRSVAREEREQSEKMLTTMKLDAQTITGLLTYITTTSFAEENRLMATITIKNKVKKAYGQHNYTSYDEKTEKEGEIVPGSEEDPNTHIDQEATVLLQQNLVNLVMTSQEKAIASCFLEIISLLGKRFVQRDWPDLINQLGQHFCDPMDQSANLHQQSLALEAIKGICTKYRYMFRSDDLFREMNFMIASLSQVLLETLVDAKETVEQLIHISNSVLHIYESLLSQEELPDFYEENLDHIATACIQLLNLQLPAYPEIEKSVRLNKARAKVVRVVHIYQFKFGEFFNKHQDAFFGKIWELVEQQKLTATKECERLVQAVVRYLGECINQPSYNEFIRNNLQAIFEVIILPNISITQEDVDEYDDEPNTYIKNDLEESDTETRRRQCMKFVAALSKRFQAEVGSLIGGFINTLQVEYEANKADNWQKKTTMVNLLITASIGQYTYRYGATELQISSEMFETYLQQLIIPELQDEKGIDNLPMLKATCMKFVYMFRNQVTDAHVPSFVNLFSNFLGSSMLVNQSYAAACIEKMLIRKKLDGSGPVLTNESLDSALLQKLLQSLCNLLNDNKDLYAIRALLRVIQITQQNLVPFASTLGQVLATFIQEAAKDEMSSSPNYTYILFESAALTLTFVKNDAQAFAAVEDQLTPVLNYIIANGVSDLMGFAFQVYATFVAASTTQKEDYGALTQSVLANMSNWDKEMKYLIPALGIFVTTMTCKYTQFVQQPEYLGNLKEVVKHLMNPEMRMEQVALNICSTIFERLDGPPDTDFLNTILYSICQSLHFYRNNTKAKLIPVSIMKAVHLFLANFMVQHGSQALVDGFALIQAQPLNIFFMILGSESDKIKTITEPARDKKYTAVAYARLVSEYAQQLPKETVQKLISALIEQACSKTGGFVTQGGIRPNDTEQMLEDGAIDQTYAFSRQTFIALTAAKIEHIDKLPQVEPRSYLIESIQKTSKTLQCQVQELLFSEKHAEMLQQLINETGVQL